MAGLPLLLLRHALALSFSFYENPDGLLHVYSDHVPSVPNDQISPYTSIFCSNPRGGMFSIFCTREIIITAYGWERRKRKREKVWVEIPKLENSFWSPSPSFFGRHRFFSVIVIFAAELSDKGGGRGRRRKKKEVVGEPQLSSIINGWQTSPQLKTIRFFRIQKFTIFI